MSLALELTYLGHSAFYIESGPFFALIDPFIKGNPKCPWTLDHIQHLTHIFVTHGHGDHIGDTLALAKKFDALVISNFEIANYLSQQGIRTHAMHVGGRRSFDFGTVKLTPALHGSSIQTPEGPRDGGSPCGFLLTIGPHTLYHAGDTGLTMDMQLLKEDQVTLAMVPIGGNYTMDAHDAKRSVSFIAPKKVIPMHYDTFDLIKADPHAFKAQVEAENPEVEVLVVTPGQVLSL